jgi:[protein-PII] uridylyltransferase
VFRKAESFQQAVQQFLHARNELVQRDLTRISGFLMTRKYTLLMDRFLRALFLKAGFGAETSEHPEDGVAVVALGSYGRRELCLGSDVDFVFVHQSTLSPEMGERISRVLYSLWDARLDVGHGVMTVHECIRTAMEDFRYLTSLMNMRLLIGSPLFFRLFAEAFWSRVDREKDSLLSRFLVNLQKRAEKYGNQGYFAEPDIKEGLGGLRDIHFMAWMARIYFKSEDLRQIKRFPVFSHFPLERLHQSENFLLKVRNRLHHFAGGRREDRLLMRFQGLISESLGYQDNGSYTGPERFMKHLYLHLNRIRYGSEEFQTRTLDLIDPGPIDPERNDLPAEFRVIKGNVVLREGRSLKSSDPLTLLRAFEQANRGGFFFGSELIWEAGHLISTSGRALFNRPDAANLFMRTLLAPMKPQLLRLALEAGLVECFIPEFRKIRHLAQFSQYHIETVDLHSLSTMEVIHEISQGVYDERWPILGEVFRELEHPDWLYLAALLHDIGKGSRGDHSQRGSVMIPRILKRLGMKGEAERVISSLVLHHLLLVNVSQKRDLNDEKTSVQAAQTIGSTEKLRLLLLLTIADSLATGPIAGSDWKVMLLIELYVKVRHILERGILATPDATKRIEQNKSGLLRLLSRRFPPGEIHQLMEQVSTWYFLSTRLDDMVEHFLLALTLGKRRLAWTLQKLNNAPVTRVLLCTYDKPGLFSKMVGVFTLNNMDVLSGNIFTLKNGLALDIYEVTNPLDPLREREMWSKVYRNAVEAIGGKLPLDLLISRKDRSGSAPPLGFSSFENRVWIDNNASDFFTIVEVIGARRTGLLYDLAKEIFSQGLDIRFARFNRDKERTTGVFYVRDSSGQKVSETAEMKRIEEGILSVIR